MVRSALTGLLLLALPWLLAAAISHDGVTEEDTELASLGPHDGMYFFDGALRKTVPPGGPAGGAPAVAASAAPCKCSDVVPRAAIKGTVEAGADCYHQRNFGACKADYMKYYLIELVQTDGFCMISCGRCNCCSPPADVLKKLGASRFLQASQAAQPSFNDTLDHPGYMATLLVPTDAAFEAALAAHPQIMQDPALLQQVLKFHIVPPEPVRRGLWTSPLMSTGPKLYTLYDGPATLQVSKFPLPPGANAYGGLKDFQIQGPVNSAKVVASDIMSCKSYITLIDTVLFPFDPKTANGAGASAVGDALGAQGSVVQANSLITGAVIKDGAGNRQRTVAACAASCAKTSSCNAFRYCSFKGGCKTSDASQYKFGDCQLQRSAEVAAGQPAAFADFGADVPFVSGYLTAGAPPVASAAAAAGRRLMQ